MILRQVLATTSDQVNFFSGQWVYLVEGLLFSKSGSMGNAMCLGPELKPQKDRDV